MKFYAQRLTILLLITGIIFTIVGCRAAQIPDDKKAYVGTWEGVGFHLTITNDGGIDYRRVKGSTTTSVNGPLKGFEGDDFVVGMLFISTTFEVQNPPFKEGDEWYMVVDGVELKKVAGPII